MATPTIDCEDKSVRFILGHLDGGAAWGSFSELQITRRISSRHVRIVSRSLSGRQESRAPVSLFYIAATVYIRLTRRHISLTRIRKVRA